MVAETSMTRITSIEVVVGVWIGVGVSGVWVGVGVSGSGVLVGVDVDGSGV